MKYINAEEFVKLYCQNHCGVHFIRCEKPCNVVLLVDHMTKQEDAIEIVRCRECQYVKALCICDSRYDDWFCADGTRKENI